MPKVGTAITVSFALFEADAFTRLTGRAAAVDVELWRADDDGGRVTIYRRDAGVVEVDDLIVTVTETATAGEYDAVFTPATAGRYFLVVRDGQSQTDLDESPIDVTALSIDDIGAPGYLVALDGAAYGIGAPLVLTWQFRSNRAPYNVVGAPAITRAELIARDAVTVLQTIQGAAFEAPSPTLRRATFAQVAQIGTYFVRLIFAGNPGEVIDRVPVDNLDAEPVAGVMSLATFFEQFCGAFPGEPPGRDLLRGDNGEQLIGDEGVAAAIRGESVYVGRRMGVTLASTRYATHPGVASPGGAPLVQGSDYDVEEDPYDWSVHNSLRLGILTLRHGPLIRINRIRLFHGHTPLFQLPTRWGVIRRKAAVVEIIVDRGDLISYGESVLAPAVTGMIQSVIAFNRMPAVWCLDYEAGLETVPDDVVAVIGMRALARILTIIGTKANKMGVSSQSTGKDGLSRSVSVTADRYQRIMQSPYMQAMISEDQLNRLRKSLKPGIKVFS
jgi:hypothetical protein